MSKPARSVLAMLLGVAQILVGCTLTCTGGISMASNALGTSKETVTVNKGGFEKQTIVYDTHEEMEKQAPGYKAFYLGTGVAGLLLALGMILGAAGMLWSRPWGWWLSLAWGVLALAYQAGVAVYLWTVAMPAVNRLHDTLPRDDAGVTGTLANTNTFFHFFWAIFASAFVLYPLLVLLLLVLPPVRRSCRPVAVGSGAWADLEEEDDRPRRRRNRDEDDRPGRRRDEDDEDNERPRRRRDRDDD